jgi:hypothetical protein
VSDKDIFSALAKYNSATDENYLTESFVFLINHLLAEERTIGLIILTQLCVNNGEFAFDTDEDISVSTQEVTEEGTPDIKISSSTKRIYIEVKHDSPVDPDQLKRYKSDLESWSADIRRLILLTRFPVDFSEHKGIPDKHVRWFEVYNWLVNTEAQDAVAIYLIEQFKSFLEVKQMSIQKVGWEYINGVPAFNNLVNMIEAAIQGASLRVHQKSAAWGLKGFYVENSEFLCGVHYNNPLIVTFELMDKKKFDQEVLTTSTYPLREGKYRLWFRLSLEEMHFFSLSKDDQLEELIKFVKTSYADAQKMRVKE